MKLTPISRKYLLYNAVMILLTAFVGYAILKWGLPSHYFKWYGVIPLLFLVLNTCSIFPFDKACRSGKKNLLAVYMGIRVVRVLAAIIVMVVVFMNGGNHRVDFLWTFYAFYLVVIAFDTYYFFSYERREKLLNSKG